MIMGLLNDIVKRDLSGDERKEDVSNMNLYPEVLVDRGPVRTGEYRKVKYEIFTTGTFPYVVMTFNPETCVRWPRVMHIKDADGNRRKCTLYAELYDISLKAYNHLVRVWYMDDTDFILGRDMNKEGKVHTVKSITDDVRVFIDQILNGKFELWAY